MGPKLQRWTKVLSVHVITKMYRAHKKNQSVARAIFLIK